MNEITPNTPNMNIDPTRRLKKVKRPVKRLVPQGQSMPATPRPQNQVQQPKPVPSQSQDMDVFNLDTYLDDSANLPTIIEESDDNTDYYAANPAQPRFISEEDIMNEQRASMGNSMLTEMISKKTAIIIAVAALLIGMLSAKLLFGEQKVVRDGLQGVVINAEVPRGRARCGVAEKTQGCVLYIMNPQRQELNASDFYDLAAQLTGRQRFVIETGNMRYSNNKIKPGEIAQFNIPPLQ